MAEIATPSPFGCAAVHNRHVTHIDITDLWVHHPQWQSTTTATITATATASSCDNNIDNNNNHNSSTHHKNSNNNWSKAREMVLSAVPTKPHHARKQSFEVSDSGGVSSLVQKWKGFEATGSPINNNNNMSVSTKSSSSQDNVYVATEPPLTPTPTLNEDYDSESDHNDRTDSVADMERLRVADIIRKWKDHTNINVGSDSPPRVIKTAASSPERIRCSSSPGVVSNSPRIRGRQAFHDLLMQIERDRTKELECLVERKPVSNFSHRGRIQALLRFRFLNRGVESKEGYHHSNERPPPVQPRSVTKTRESVILPERMDDTCTTQNTEDHENRCIEDNNSSNSCSENGTDTTIQGSEVPVTPRQHDVGQSPHKVNEDTENNGRLFHRYENLGHEKNPFSTLLIRREKEITESPCTSTSVCNKEEYDETNDHTVMKKSSNYDPTSDYEEPPTSYHEDEATSSQQDLVDDTAGMYWVHDHVPNTEADVWEDIEFDDQEENEGINREWIGEVSRPRSDWEDLRQARYQEMLDPFSENEEIRILLGRKSVSSFLSSDLRDKIDQMMALRVQGPQTPKSTINRAREEKHETRLSEQVDAVIIPDKQITEEEEEVLNDVSFQQQYNNESDDNVFADQITASPQESSSPQNQLGSDYSYMDASPSTQHSSSNYYSQNSRPNSSNSARPEVDRELIYDLRGHMQQLHQEMSELRMSIKCCVDMQIELQRSVKKEITIALRHSEAKNRRRNHGMKTSVGGKCCVCCKMQVDTLLYRCGHMCTCYKCAHKLLWSSGKCPVCRAPILDVVQTNSNHS